MQSARELRSHAGDEGAEGKSAARQEPEPEHAGGTLAGPGPQTVFGPPPFTMPFSPGQVLAGKYEVVSLIGVGGISFVVAALHRGFDNYVALKFLRPEFALHPEAARRFIAEAKSNFKLRSEHIVRVLDVDRLPNEKPFMVMERLAGFELRALIADRGPLSVELAVDFALQTCEALATAHAARVIHRDIKPENLFVTRHSDQPEQIKVLDFGICREVLTLDQPHQRIVTTEAVGSPPYMSPEQVRGAPDIDARSDIWSLGCVLYEMLSGTAPFHRPSAPEAFAAVLEAPAPPLRELVADLPQELDAVVARCLAKEPRDRFQSVAELADALVPFAPVRAYANAARSAQILDEAAERRSGVQYIARASFVPTQSSDALPGRRSAVAAWVVERKSVLLPLSLVLCVPLVSALSWLSFAGDRASQSSHQRASSTRVTDRTPATSLRQQQVGPIEVSPLEPTTTHNASTTGPLSARQTPAPSKARASGDATQRSEPAAPTPLRALPAQVRPYLPEPDPYAEPPPPEADGADPDVGF
jgi:serine/threonine protein kinase